MWTRRKSCRFLLSVIRFPAIGFLRGKMKRDKVIFYLNGVRHEAGPEHARMMLADYLRYVKSLTGTKIVCAEGDCGACSVLRYFPLEGKDFLPINSCITTVAQMDASSLVTVDALAQSGLTPVQDAMVRCHGSQCGFCTPGFVVALTGLVEKKLARGDAGAKIAEKEAKNALTGNLCRCTGYQPILEAAQSIPLANCEPLAKRFLTPAIQRDLKSVLKSSLVMQSDAFTFLAPTKLAELKKIKHARFIGAGTDLGVQHNKRKTRLENLVSLHLIPELYTAKKAKGTLTVGARVTLSRLREYTKGSELARFLDLFASPQIKNVATLVGNVGNASPIADTPPFLLASDALLHTLGPRGKRKLPFGEFFLGYRKTALRPGECITAIEFPLEAKNEKIALYKASQRKDLDISAVNAAFRFSFMDKNITSAKIALGGVAATTIRLPKLEKFLAGKDLSSELTDKAAGLLQDEIRPLSDLRGSAAFRRVLAGNFLRQFLADCEAR